MKFERRLNLKNEIKIKTSGIKNIKALLENEKGFYETLLARIIEQARKKKSNEN